MIGDLVERYRERPSRGWYWRQVCHAILAETADEFRKHRFLAARAIMNGFVILVLFDRTVIRLLESVSFQGAIWIGGYVFVPGPWVVRPIWIASLPIGGLLAGSAVGRFHRPSMIGIFGGSFVVWQFVQFWLFVAVKSVWIPVGDYVLFSMLLFVSVLVGGIWTARPKVARHRLA